MDCLTDDEGPERHTKCRFPFKYNGNLEIFWLTFRSRGLYTISFQVWMLNTA